MPPRAAALVEPRAADLVRRADAVEPRAAALVEPRAAALVRRAGVVEPTGEGAGGVAEALWWSSGAEGNNRSSAQRTLTSAYYILQMV